MAAPNAHVGILVAASILCGTTVRAHHSFGAEYDAQRPVTVTGVVTKIEWTNPHNGDSVGHWEGDTLVVDVTGFNDRTWIAGTGTFHTEALHVVERYTRVDKDQINWEATLEDPNVLTRPWVLKATMMLREGTRIEENVCENNVDVDRYEQLLKQGVDFTRH